jgi:inosose dehydratase
MKNDIPSHLETREKEPSISAPGTARREFLKELGAMALAWGAASPLAGAVPGALHNPVGYSTISWPDNQLDQALEGISSVGFKGVQLMGEVVENFAGDNALRLKERLTKLHLVATALSCHNVPLAPGKSDVNVANFRLDIEFMKTLGGLYFQVTDGGRWNVNYTDDQVKTLGASMNELGKMAKDAGLVLGYHPHVGMLGETREGVRRVLDATQPEYVKLIVDVAHLALGGSDPAEVIRTYRERLLFFHLKDVRKDTDELMHKDHAAGERMRLRFCEIGTGVLDFQPIIQAIRDVKFKGWMVVELDRYTPPPGGPTEAARTNKAALEKLGFRI